MLDAMSKRSAPGDNGDLKIEVQENLSRVPSYTSTVADVGVTGNEAQQRMV